MFLSPIDEARKILRKWRVSRILKRISKKQTLRTGEAMAIANLFGGKKAVDRVKGRLKDIVEKDRDRELAKESLENSLEQSSKEVWLDNFKEKYSGKMCMWTPSGAENPDPDHMRNYGRTFDCDKGIDGELPGERWGCQCGIRVLN